MGRQGPLEPRDGLNASRIRMPRSGPWATVWGFLADRYGMSASDLAARAGRGELVLENGQCVSEATSYRPGSAVFLRRVAPDEPTPAQDVAVGGVGDRPPLPVLHRDARLLAVDKPPGVASTPRGQHVAGSVVVRLRRELGLPELSPVHRLDRLTAGVLLFTTSPRYRAAYQGLFERHEVRKTYHAVAGVRPGLRLPVTVRNRVSKPRGRLQAEVVPGEPNAVTTIEMVRQDGPLGRYRLTPLTGRTHQLRLHMAHLGIPIVGDPLYPQVRPSGEWDRARLALLAHSLSFCDPFSGRTLRISSRRELGEWVELGGDHVHW